MVKVIKIMGTSYKKSHTCTAAASMPPTLQQATADPCLHQRLLDIHGHVWVSFLWGHCSFLLGPGAHKVLLVPSLMAQGKASACNAGDLGSIPGSGRSPGEGNGNPL